MPKNDNDNFTFSTPLKLRLVAYFRKHYDLDIKDEEADLFLTSLAALYGAMAKAVPPASGPLKRPEAAGGAPGARNTRGTFPNAT